jgi:hypothetical protein
MNTRPDLWVLYTRLLHFKFLMRKKSFLGLLRGAGLQDLRQGVSIIKLVFQGMLTEREGSVQLTSFLS